MKRAFLELLRSPVSGKPFAITIVREEGGEILEGELFVEEEPEERYPIRDGIARIVPQALLSEIERKTQRNFGYQWTQFGKDPESFEENFLNYIAPVSKEFFAGKRGVDAGCGFGRHIYQAARFGADMVGLDLSAAIDVTRNATRGMDSVNLVQGDIYNPPLAPQSVDFVYSIGVLHHLPDPLRGFQSIVRLVKPGGFVMIWVYSTSRRWVNRSLEAARWLTTRLGPKSLHVISWIGALADWCLAICPYKALSRVPGLGRAVERLAPARVKLYATYPFSVCLADWFDRLAAPIRFYYDPPSMEAWARSAGLEEVEISPTGLYGWRLQGRTPADSRHELRDTSLESGSTHDREGASCNKL